MRKFLLITVLFFLTIPLSGLADNRMMLFKTSDGDSRSISSSGLEIKFIDGNMVAGNGEETLTLPLSDLVSMEFSVGSSSIVDITGSFSSDVAVFNINGINLGTYSSPAMASRTLPAGLYVMKFKSGETQKLIIRK